MDFDQLLLRAFGTSDLSALPHDQLLAGVEKLRAQFDAEEDGEDRFAIWCLLYMLGAAPDLEDAFDEEDDREAARDFVASIDEDD
ncbi:hypothetical protein [Sphingomonas nostoxanthinifaciens]|uniref:hypothetical protein n=1 Tax=Sphingomonas nostoxanthinifaciens TaxID=2872652 RepID=UPI001CC1D23D|nr:hypothetical protein [Sphingomonas nostoxanthinifaciens]UAK23211.1 hypothetical protein K8P63_12415 [Sphingomonas nostoxanthinifaciens]